MLCLLVCGVLLGVAEGALIPYYDLSVNHDRNQSEQWLVEIKVDHEDNQPWNMLFQQTNNYTVAKLAPLATEDKKLTGAKKCPPPGYEEMFGLGYYKVYGEKDERQWQEAEDLCESEGGHLLVIDSEQELLYARLMALTQKKGNIFYFHVGIHDQYKEGDYVTVLNKTMESTRYSSWYPSKPNGGTSYNCVLFEYTLSTHQYGLTDWSCTYKRGFICEIENY